MVDHDQILKISAECALIPGYMSWLIFTKQSLPRVRVMTNPTSLISDLLRKRHHSLRRGSLQSKTLCMRGGLGGIKNADTDSSLGKSLLMMLRCTGGESSYGIGLKVGSDAIVTCSSIVQYQEVEQSI